MLKVRKNVVGRQQKEKRLGGRRDIFFGCGLDVGLMVMMVECGYERGLNFRPLIHEISAIRLLDRKNDSNGVVHEN